MVSPSGQVKICISNDIIEEVVNEAHEQEGEHQPLQQHFAPSVDNTLLVANAKKRCMGVLLRLFSLFRKE